MAYELSDLLNDDRLERLFSSERRPCAFQLWVLQIQCEDVIENRVIYGRLLPYSFSNNRWSFSDDDSNYQSFGESKASITQLNLYIDSSLCSSLLTMIIEGKNLDDISTALDFTFQSKLQNRFGDVSLSNSYIGFRPVAYLLNRDAHVSDTLASPLGNAGAFSASIFQGDKQGLFLYDEVYDKNLTSMIIARLNSDTGMDFGKKDLERIADIELLVFPTIDDQENSLFAVEWTEEKDIEIRFNTSQLPSFDNFSFILTLINNNQVFYSCCAIANNIESLSKYVFKLDNNLKNIVDSSRVDIYASKGNETGEGYLCCSWKIYYCREISFQLTAMGNSSNSVEFDWLERTTNPSMGIRVRNALSFSDANYVSNNVIGERELDKWVPENRAIKSLFKKLYPPISNGSFFLRWGQSNGEGRLQFVEWFKEILKENGQYHIAIFDPYFEDVGSALLTLYASRDAEYTVFRTVPESKNGKVKQGVDNLLENCEHNRERLSRSKVKIYGLKEGRLHDRYILIIGNDGLPVEGYHLSNSFQSVAQNFPLLVTPIPTDTLYQVKQYTLDIIQQANESSNDSDITLLFETEDSSKELTNLYNPLSILENRLSGSLFSVWFEELSLKGLYGNELKKELQSLGLIEGVSLHSLTASGLYNCIDNMQEDFTDFYSQWDMIGHILANSHIIDSNLDEISSKTQFLLFLSEFLSEAFKMKFTDGSKNVAVIDPSYLTESLRELTKNPIQTDHFNRPSKNDILSWSDFYAIKLLWQYRPECLLLIISKQAGILKVNPESNHIVRLSLLEQVLHEISLAVNFKQVSNYQTSLLIISNTGIINWFGWVLLEQNLKSSNNFDLNSSFLSIFSYEEKIQFVGWSLNRNAESSESKLYYEKLVGELHKFLPEQVPDNSMQNIIDSAKGYHKQLKWSEPWLFIDIINPLLLANRVNYDYICEIWMQELIAQFENTDENESVIFSPDREQVTTQVCAYLWVNSSKDYKDKCIENLHRIILKQKRIIQRPLARSINWNKWDKALKISLWILILTKLFENNLATMQGLIPKNLENLMNYSYILALTRPSTEWLPHSDLFVYLEGIAST